MSLNDRDPAHLHDILDATVRAKELLEDASLESFREDWRTRLAVERLFEIIGEAARRIDERTRSRYPEIPWREIIGLRNIISHEYDKIDDEEIFRIASVDIPDLKSNISRILQEIDANPSSRSSD